MRFGRSTSIENCYCDLSTCSEGFTRLDNSKWELMNRVLGSLDPAFTLHTKILGYYNERSYGAILVMVIAFIGRLNPRSFKSKSFGRLLIRIWNMEHKESLVFIAAGRIG